MRNPTRLLNVVVNKNKGNKGRGQHGVESTKRKQL